MSFFSHLLKEDCVYWSPSGRDEFGTQTFGEPVQLRCRWEDGERIITDGITKQEIIVSSTVFLLVPVELQGMLKYGTLEDLDEEDNDPWENDAREIRRTFRTPSVDGRDFLYEGLLV